MILACEITSAGVLLSEDVYRTRMSGRDRVCVYAPHGKEKGWAIGGFQVSCLHSHQQERDVIKFYSTWKSTLPSWVEQQITQSRGQVTVRVGNMLFSRYLGQDGVHLYVKLMCI